MGMGISHGESRLTSISVEVCHKNGVGIVSSCKAGQLGSSTSISIVFALGIRRRLNWESIVKLDSRVSFDYSGGLENESLPNVDGVAEG